MRSLADTGPGRLAATTAALLALAVVLGYLEAVLVPPLPVPGVKLGLANLAVIVALVRVGAARAAFVSLGRVLLVSLAVGTLGGPAFLLSLGGALAAFVVMWALSLRATSFSPVGWSVAGAAAHVTAQLFVAAALAGSPAPLALLPLSLAASLPFGLALGFLARTVLSRLPELSLSVAGR